VVVDFVASVRLWAKTAVAIVSFMVWILETFGKNGRDTCSSCSTGREKNAVAWGKKQRLSFWAKATVELLG
jgi:hypothetical protein